MARPDPQCGTGTWRLTFLCSATSVPLEQSDHALGTKDAVASLVDVGNDNLYTLCVSLV